MPTRRTIGVEIGAKVGAGTNPDNSAFPVYAKRIWANGKLARIRNIE